jgi:hypothetical protein
METNLNDHQWWLVVFNLSESQKTEKVIDSQKTMQP